MEKAMMHAEICTALTDLYQRKNHDYGDSFGKSYQEYGMIMACIRLEDKLNRLKSLCKQEAKVQDESLEDTLMDLANYAIMTLVERKTLDPSYGLSIEEMDTAISNACKKLECHACPIYSRDRECCDEKYIEKNYKAMLEAGCFDKKEE